MSTQKLIMLNKCHDDAITGACSTYKYVSKGSFRQVLRQQYSHYSPHFFPCDVAVVAPL